MGRYYNQDSYLLHSSGPWKKHKYLSKIKKNGKWIYKYAREVSGLNDRDAVLADRNALNKTRKELLDASTEANKTARVAIAYDRNNYHTYEKTKIYNPFAVGDAKKAATNYWNAQNRYDAQLEKYSRTPIGRIDTFFNRNKYAYRNVDDTINKWSNVKTDIDFINKWTSQKNVRLAVGDAAGN